MEKRSPSEEVSYLEGVQFDHGLEGKEQHQLLVGVAFDPVFLLLLAVARLVVGEEHANAAAVRVHVQQLAAWHLDLVRDIFIATGKLCTVPGIAAAAAAGLLGARDLGVELLKDGGEHLKIYALDTLHDFTLAEDDEGRQCRDLVVIRDGLLRLGIDLGEGHDVRP